MFPGQAVKIRDCPGKIGTDGQFVILTPVHHDKGRFGGRNLQFAALLPIAKLLWLSFIITTLCPRLSLLFYGHLCLSFTD